MARIEKTVFISYRRKDISWALLVYHRLTANGYDVFFDYTSIPSGDFEQIIISNIKARAHFLVILTPTSLDRCNEPGDWLRREIETAISVKRNIVPLFFDSFSFGTPSVSKKLTGQLSTIKKYNGLEVPASYFDAAMDRLRSQFLNIALDAVLHPISDEVQKAVKEQQVAANEAIKQKNENEMLDITSEVISSQAVEDLPDHFALKNMEFCRISAGPFLMGSSDRDKHAFFDREKPQHLVDIPCNYWIGRFPVTNEQYNTFTQFQDEQHPVLDWEAKHDHPVVSISWDDAVKYCAWLYNLVKDDLRSDFIVRLPTEAEWEKAARGTDGRIYPWGNNFELSRCNIFDSGINTTTPVGTYSQAGDSPFGIADMIGNVWEWTHSLNKRYPYQVDDGREERSPRSEREARGGSFDDPQGVARCACRNYYYPDYSYQDLGFRVCISSKL